MTSPSRTVRVFISSTFRDFGEERDLLVKRVFPELRRRARERLVEVIGVDLRWGITEEESERGETLPICLREIERSRPYFIGLLGERYGWTPAAGEYPELLMVQQPWLREHAGGASVTELEVLHGVLNDPEMAGRAFFFFRDPAWAEGKGPDFASEGEGERARLGRLKERIRASRFPVVEYRTPEEVAERITDDLWRLIDAEYPQEAVPDELERMRRGHEAYASERRRLYVGQEETVGRLLGRIESASDEPGEAGSRTRITVVTGESGTGKSALVANVMEAYRGRRPGDLVIEHYVGCSAEASDPLRLMRRIADEIRRRTGSTTEIEPDEDKLIEQFASWVAEGSFWAGRNGGRMVLVIDALDKLTAHATVRWLPRMIPPHVQVVVSTLEGESLEALRSRGLDEMPARPFTPEVARSYLVETLARRGRKLPEAEVARIIAHPRTTLPIFLKTLVEELSVFGSFEGLPARITECLAAKEPDDLFEVILERLERDLGEETVRKPLEAIWASSEGMNDDELIEFTGVTPIGLASLKRSLDESMYDPDGLNMVAHAYLSKGIVDRYLPNEARRRELNRHLGLWWEQREPSGRMATSMDFHLFRAHAWDDLERCLTAPRTGIAAIRWIPNESLYPSWTMIAEHAGEESTCARIERSLEHSWESWRKAIAEQPEPFAILWTLSDFLEMAGSSKALAQRVVDEQTRVARSRAELAPSRAGMHDLSSSLADVARLALATGDHEAALRAAEESLRVLRSQAGLQSDPDMLRDVAAALNTLGAIAESRDEPHSALSLYAESLAVTRKLAKEHPSSRSLQDLSTCLVNVGNAEHALGDARQALTRYTESLGIDRHLASESDALDRQRNLSLTLQSIAEIEKSLERHEAARSILKEALTTSRRLASIIGNPESLRDLSVCLDRMSETEHSLGNEDVALAYALESLEITRHIARETDTPSSWRDVCVSLGEVTHLQLATGDLEAARRLRIEALEIARRTHAAARSRRTRRDLGCAIGELALIEDFLERSDSAYEGFLESLAIMRELAREDIPESLRDMNVALDQLARLDLRRGGYRLALERASESLAIARRIAATGLQPRFNRDLSATLLLTADAERAVGNNERARRMAMESLALRNASLEGPGTAEARRDVRECLEKLAHYDADDGEHASAIARLDESLRLSDELLAEDGDSSDLNSAVWALHLLGRQLLALNRSPEACTRLAGRARSARELADVPGCEPEMLDTCIKFWSTLAAAQSAAGQKWRARLSEKRVRSLEEKLKRS